MATHYSPRWTKIPDGFRQEPPHTPSILIQVESRGANDSDTSRRQRVVIDGSQVLSIDAPRSYRMTRLVYSGGWQYNSSNGYDVYGSQTAADSALAYLQTFSSGDILILNTNDEPNNRRTTFRNELINNFYAGLQYSNVWEHRCSYMLIAVKNKGLLYESIKPRYHTTGHYVTLYLG